MPGCPVGPIRCHAFFNKIDWERLELRKVDPPFRPRVDADDDDDAANFDPKYTLEKAQLSIVDRKTQQMLQDDFAQEHFRGFSFTHPRMAEFC